MLAMLLIGECWGDGRFSIGWQQGVMQSPDFNQDYFEVVSMCLCFEKLYWNKQY